MSSSKKVIYAALVGNGLIAITKFVAATITGSSAMFSEGIHSVVDTGNQVLLLYGIKKAQRPACKRFPFGHGKEIYFWSFAVAILNPQPMGNPMINYIVLGLAFLFEGAAWFFAFTEFNRAKGKWGYIEAVQRGKDPTMFVVLFEDSAAMLGIIVAFLGVLLTDQTGILIFDGIASIISANQSVIKGIRKIIRALDGVEHINEVLTMHMGPEFILVNISINFRDDIPAGDLEELINRMDMQIKETFPFVKRIFVEAESRRLKNQPG
jgi:divalent metal cation (Fe/Co/Zn/Cd) transporter